jgi:hypothetical protein
MDIQGKSFCGKIGKEVLNDFDNQAAIPREKGKNL